MPSNTHTGTSTTDELRTSAADLGQKAGDAMDSGRHAAADRMASAAGALHDRANDLPGGPRVAGFANRAADKLDSTATYVRDHDFGAVFADVQALVKRNPVPSLLGAAALGFLLAKIFTRD